MTRLILFVVILTSGLVGRVGAQTAFVGGPDALSHSAAPAAETPAPASAPAEAVSSRPAAAPAVYYAADEMPSFPGGDAGLLKFLTGKLQYPAPALERNLSGKVYLTFVVDPQGRVRDPQVVRGLGFGLDEEALRLVRLMPWWTPGKVHGQPVAVSITMPIVFRAL